ncbi:hypothetical protein, partial [Pseudomonas marginalis]|uniref:hypothetical protein n=1 Tax=Pseudomonas marginalis TaxID=298 RepID=UPI0034D66173
LDWLHDSLVLQKDCRIPTFNLDSAPKSYLSDGAVNNSALIFPTRCATYPGKTCYVRKVKSRYLTDFGNVCGIRVDWTVELIAI